ncbi:hypothetical protein A8C32_18855 [Flavivirga aquatica]|uniref:Uncharacterized protein n=1 Tax=Flavivirga aquatica TaxID=1849968 RepID=A0A1E5T3Y6_9FLAO|nr:hypothetical protein [Flavivirga aquatica]OEK06092.1 hypothetical protein A8C32_18855 [Flavivirga aquatica]
MNVFSLEKLKELEHQIGDYKEYDLFKIMAIELALISSNNEAIKLATFGKFFFFYNFEKLRLNRNLFFAIGNHGRKDYNEIINYVKNKFEKSSYSFFDYGKAKIRLKINVKNILTSLITGIRLKGNISYKNRFLIASKICFYKNTIDNLEKVKLEDSLKKAIVFSSVHPLEGLFLYFFKKRKTPVYSLQHGVYYIYKKTPPIDCILYENFNADFHLCWGEYSKKELISYGINRDKILVAGYPKNSELRINTNIITEKCIVLLARSIFNESNKKLISVLKQFIKKEPKAEFYFKLHPSLNRGDYNDVLNTNNFFLIDDEITLKEILIKSDYSKAICVYTTAYYEAYLNGIVALRYYDGKSELSEGVQDDVFENIDDLLRVFNLSFSKNEIERKLQHVIGLNVDNYFEILN